MVVSPENKFAPLFVTMIDDQLFEIGGASDGVIISWQAVGVKK